MKGINGGHKEDKDKDKEKIERKHKVEKGVERLERHPADGLPLKHDPKKGHGGKYSWEGPYGLDSESDSVPAAMDQNDPNYVDGDDDLAAADDTNSSKDKLIGEVETPAVAPTGVARIELDPALSSKVDLKID